MRNKFLLNDHVIVNTGGEDFKAVLHNEPHNDKGYCWKQEGLENAYRCKFENGTSQYIDESNIRLDKRELAFVTIDYWSRPVFKDIDGALFGCLEKLFQEGSTFEDVTNKEDSQFVDEHDICYFGRDIDGDPLGSLINTNMILLVKEFKYKEDGKD